MDKALTAELLSLVNSDKFKAWFVEYLVGSGKPVTVKTLVEAACEYLDMLD